MVAIFGRFLVEMMDRSESFKGRDFNSHAPVVERYSRMTALFEPTRTSLIGGGPSVSKVITLLKAKH